MAGRFIVFNGQVKFVPGAITKIINQGAARPGLSATGIIGVIGEAEGGEPNQVVTIDDPALAQEVFRDGPLANAVRIAFEPSNDIQINGGAFRVLAYKVNQSTQASTHVPGDEAEVSDTVDTGATTTVIPLTSGGLTVDAQIGRFAEISGEKRRIVDNTASQITVDPGFSSAPAQSTAVNILETQMIVTAEDYGKHTNQIFFELEDGATSNKKVVTVGREDFSEQSPEIAGDAFLRLKYVGGPILDSGDVTNISSDGLTVTVDVASAPSANAFDGKILQFDDGTQRLVASHDTSDPVVITLDSAHALSTQEQEDLDTATATIRDVDSATASIAGSQGEATSLTSSVSPTADDLNLTFDTDQTLRQLVDEINSNTNYEATIPSGVNPDTTLMKTFDFGTRATNVDVRFDDEISPDDNGSFRRDLQVVVDWLNDFSSLVSAARADTGTGEGSELPQNTGGQANAIGDVSLALTGGSRGTSSNTNWQDGFDALLNERVQHVVPLISQDLTNEGNGSSATFDSVAAQLLSHVQTARGAAQSERGGYLGVKGGLAKLLDTGKTMNDADVQVYGQRFKTLDVNGSLKEFDEWSAAVTAAGMRSGAPEVGTPLTFKAPKTTSIAGDSSWSPQDRTDRNALIEGGIMVAEEAPNGGFRWLRDITTHLSDDNVVLIDAHTRDAVRFVAFDLRTFLENRFTGQKATPATVSSIREAVVEKMALYLTDNIVVESNDPDGINDSVVYPGFRNLKVSLSGNTATIQVEVFPVTGIVFQTISLYLQLPRIVA